MSCQSGNSCFFGIQYIQMKVTFIFTMKNTILEPIVRSKTCETPQNNCRRKKVIQVWNDMGKWRQDWNSWGDCLFKFWRVRSRVDFYTEKQAVLLWMFFSVIYWSFVTHRICQGRAGTKANDTFRVISDAQSMQIRVRKLHFIERPLVGVSVLLSIYCESCRG